MKELTVTGTLENLDMVLDFVNKELEANKCSNNAKMQISLSIEEIFVNIASYAYAPGTGEVKIGMDVSDGIASISFEDRGVPYNLLEKPNPDIMQHIDEKELGGLGIFIVKKNMDDLFYQYNDNRNIFTMKKKIN